MMADYNEIWKEIYRLQQVCRSLPGARQEHKTATDALRNFLGAENISSTGVFKEIETIDSADFLSDVKHPFSGGNTILLSSASTGDVSVWFFGFRFAQFHSAFSSFPSILDTPYLTRAAALRAAVFRLRRYLDEVNPKAAREKKLDKALRDWLASVEEPLIKSEARELWLCRYGDDIEGSAGTYTNCCYVFGCNDCRNDECGGPYPLSVDGELVLDAELLNCLEPCPENEDGPPASKPKKCSHEHAGCNNDWCENCKAHKQCCAECTEPCNARCGWAAEVFPVSDGGQLRLGDAGDGFVRPEDVEKDSRVNKIYSELSELHANKKQMTQLQKAYGRRALYLSITGAIESARAKSALDGGLWLAADTFVKIEEMSAETAKELPDDVRERMIIYAVFEDGAEVEHSRFHEAMEARS